MRLKLSLFKLHPIRVSIVLLFALVGTYFLVISHAQTPAITLTAVSGNINGSANSSRCSGSNDQCILFNAPIPGPTNLQVIDKSTTEASLTWSPPVGWSAKTNNLIGYKVYRDGVLLTRVTSQFGGPVAGVTPPNSLQVPNPTTTPAYSPNFLDIGLVRGSTHSYFVQAITTSGQTSPDSNTLNVTLNSNLPTALLSCPATGDNSQVMPSGDYVLNSDLSFSNTSCFRSSSFQLSTGQTNINIDCQGHSITYTGNDGGANIFSLDGVSNSIVVNCKFFNQSPTVLSGINAVSIHQTSNSVPYPDNNNTVEYNVLGDSNGPSKEKSLDITQGNTQNSIAEYNYIYSGDMSISGNNNMMNSNTVYACSNVAITAIVPNTTSNGSTCPWDMSAAGDNVTLAYNYLDGMASTSTSPNPNIPYHYFTNTAGTDDAFTGNYTNSSIVYNQGLNYWDCGIEVSGNSNFISFNSMTNVIGVGCGIGDWYGLNFTNNEVDYNTFNNDEGSFTYELRLPNSEPLTDFAGNYYFTNNSFIGNKGNGQSPTNESPILNGAGFPSLQLGEHDSYSGENNINVIAYNNYFKNNVLLSHTSGIWHPTNNITQFLDPTDNIVKTLPAFIDGGGNTFCGSDAALIFALATPNNCN